MSLQDRDFYLTVEHACAYFDDRLCQNIVPDPNIRMHSSVYEQLGMIGFRRSGDHVYRPHCKDCKSCIPCRIDINRFTPNRSQRRCLRQNSAITVEKVSAEFTNEYFELYKKYLNHRHAGGEMSNPSEDDFKNFLICNWSDSHFLTFREDDHLLAIAVIDKILNGFSAVYTFFDPDFSHRSLGTFAILQEIQHCKNHQLPFLYLGYWIDQHPKMHYKAGFNAIDVFHNNHWRALEKPAD
ncbi:MAG: arginyltransferase [Gammaproteobacteria bacterium]|nr:arginyltransferase [Gammaproteobacteria bacterium]